MSTLSLTPCTPPGEPYPAQPVGTLRAADAYRQTVEVATDADISDAPGLVIQALARVAHGAHGRQTENRDPLVLDSEIKTARSPKHIAVDHRDDQAHPHETPLWSPERIYDQLVSLGLTAVPASNTIAKYLPDARKQPSEQQRQSWRTFLVNHRHDIWAMDFFTMPTLFFKVLYVLVIIRHDRIVIQHVAVTMHPTADWVVQQLREATPFGEQPKYVIHDKDAVLRSQAVQDFLSNASIKSVRTGFKRPQQNGVAERVNGTLRRELLDHYPV
jgi:transposase InsO family protein